MSAAVDFLADDIASVCPVSGGQYMRRNSASWRNAECAMSNRAPTTLSGSRSRR